MNEKEIREMIEKLNNAIESVDDELKAGKKVIGIMIIRWTEPEQSHEKVITAMGDICAGCLESIASKFLVDTFLSKLDGISIGKSGAAFINRILLKLGGLDI